MEKGIPPICRALALCDGLYRSPSTGRMSLLETIGNGLLAVDWPQPWSPIAVYLVLTSGRGSTTLTLRWTGPDGEPLPGSEQQLEVDFASPLEMLEGRPGVQDPGRRAVRMGAPGIEPGTSPLSGVRSSRLSYAPVPVCYQGQPPESQGDPGKNRGIRSVGPVRWLSESRPPS